MSKTLMSKINNILDIDVEKEYINFFPFIKDMINLNHYVNTEKIIDSINNQKTISFAIAPNFREMLETISSFKNFNDLNEYLKQNNISLDFNFNLASNDNKSKKKKDYDINEINDELFLFHKKQIYDLSKKELLKPLESFNQLNKMAISKFVENGRMMLRLGTDFICGNINKISFNAPLFLYDVEIIISNDNEININFLSNKMVNEKLLLVIKKELKLSDEILNITSIDSFEKFKEIIEPIVQYLIIDSDTNEFKESYEIKTLKHYSIFYLGLFDIKPGKIKEDFINLMKNNVSLMNDKMINDFEFYTKQEFTESALIQINNPLNIYQKYALRSAVNENTLIYGPPGTGKSEIIASLIANLLIKSKTILLISQKDAALDVIKERLNNLSILALYLKDIQNEELFYEQIEKISIHMGSFYNENYIKEEFDLSAFYNENERVKDYNREIKKFRNIIHEQINFSLEKDSRGNDYKDYLLSINIVNKFVKNNGSDITNFWKEYHEKRYVKLQSPTEFIAKVAQYNWFKNTYQLNEDDIAKFDKERQQLNKFLVDANLIHYKIESFDELKKLVNKLELFINDFMLHKNNEFIDSLKKDPFFLSNNLKYWKQIDTLLDTYDKTKASVKNKLTKNYPKHEKFLIQYLKTSENEKINLIKRYYLKNEINTKRFLFSSNKDDEFYKTFYECVKIFEKMKIFKSNLYLNKMQDYDSKIFDPLVVYFYTNQKYLKPSFIDFYNQKIINFDERILNQYYKLKINQIERELININVYNFEKYEKNRHIIERDIPYLIEQYLKNNADFILNMDNALLEIYLKHIKNKLAKSSKKIQEKIEQMFKIVRLENKPKINDFLINYFDCLKLIFPIWISKPEILCHYYPLEKNVFDVGIFDEASQMFLEKAYPLIYRCKYIVVSGDDKQLKPERIIFNEIDMTMFENKPLVKDIEFDISESLLDRAKVSYWNTFTLRNHYRSKAKELINFSNQEFYDNKLIFSSKNKNNVLAYEVINCSKAQENFGVNKEEIKRIVSIIKRESKNYVKTLVICFTSEQKEALLQHLTNLNDKNINELLKNNLIIRDLSTVQGDEGDLVIISNVFTTNSKEYGLLVKLRGQNYLNVAITRAKEKIIVVKSLNKNNIKINKDFDLNSFNTYKKWIENVDQLITDKTKEQAIRNNISTSNYHKDIYLTLKKDKRFNKLQIAQNINVGSQPIDIGFYEKEITDIKLVLMLDDWKKCINYNEWFEDIDKQEYLKARGYEIMRIEETDWLLDPVNVINQIAIKLNLNNINSIKKKKNKK